MDSLSQQVYGYAALCIGAAICFKIAWTPPTPRAEKTIRVADAIWRPYSADFGMVAAPILRYVKSSSLVNVLKLT